MRHYAVLVLCLFGLSCRSIAGEVAPDSEFVRLEQVWNEAHLKSDAAALDALWADDLTVIVPAMAPMSKADALSFAKSGRMKFSRYETTDLTVRNFGDFAIVSGNLFRSRTLGGTLREDRWQFMKVYARRSGKWMVAGFTATEAPGP
jgi:ketosteroid isomerase-like protein